jgi:hypothetical protein
MSTLPILRFAGAVATEDNDDLGSKRQLVVSIKRDTATIESLAAGFAATALCFSHQLHVGLNVEMHGRALGLGGGRSAWTKDTLWSSVQSQAGKVTVVLQRYTYLQLRIES